MNTVPRTRSLEANGRILSVDALRGIAAFAVLIFHFPHFAAVSAGAHTVGGVIHLPFESILYPIYRHGWMAVDLFFIISGFIFCALYADSVAERRVSARSFFTRRFCRLYPLHFTTLIIVGVLQYFYLSENGLFFIYQTNNLYHFALNILLLNGTPLAGAESFNGPSWSLSVEALLYASFFLFARLRWMRPAILIVIVTAGMGLYMWNAGIGRGVMAFYLGGLLYLLVQRRDPATQGIRRLLLCATLAGWGIALVEIYTGAGYRSVMEAMKTVAPSLSATFEHYYPLMGATLVRLCLFPLTLLCTLSFEQPGRWLWKRLEWLGDFSYSTYLVHIPVQLLLVLVWQQWGDVTTLVSPFGLALFLALTMAVAALSFHWFEKPAQSWLRQRMDRRRN